MSFELSKLLNSSIWQVYRMRERIQLNPDYQRAGGIWRPENRQLLIDSILNGFDIPKLYLHKFLKPQKANGKTHDFAIVDGKQRLETLWHFIDGKIALADNFTLFANKNVKAGGMKYEELGKEYPELKADFDAFTLSVMLIETDDLDMIDEMFSRLNEAAPLSGAEKRNAYPGPIPGAIRKLAKETFFLSRIPFPNSRYRHYDLAAKFLLAEFERKVVDTKKTRLDDFAERFESKPRTKMPKFLGAAQSNCSRMAKVFADGDSLLKQVGMVMLYYHLFRIANKDGWTNEITRKKLVDFDILREKNRLRAEKEQDSSKVDLDLLEFERYAQSPNDGAALRFRLGVMMKKVFNKKVEAESF